MPATVTRPGRAGVTSIPGRRSRLIRLASTALPAARLGTPPLRTTGSHQREQRPASWLELFFDLVFAGAIGQLAGALQDHPALGTLARFAMLFTPIWWLWVQFTFYADRHESDDAAHRAAFLSAMVLCVGLAASGPRALSGHATAFIVAVILLRGLQLLLYARARRHLPATRALYTRYLIFFGAAGILWLASLTAGGMARYALWGAALLTDAAGALEMLPPSRPVPVNPWHLADRFQLLVLIVLGESVARLISAAAVRSWSAPLAVVLAAALLTLAALWWAWLTTADRDALGTPNAMARFTAASLPIVGSIAAASAGLHIAILAAHNGGAIGIGPRSALYGGVSVYLLASAVLPSGKLTRQARTARLASSLAAMGLVFMGAIVPPVYLVPALTAILALGLAAEAHPDWLPARTRSRHARTPRKAKGSALMTGSTLNQPSGPEPVTTTVAGRRLTRLAEAGVAFVFGVPDYNFGILAAVIARLGPATSGRAGSQWRPRASSALSSPAGRGLSISPPFPAPTWWRP